MQARRRVYAITCAGQSGIRFPCCSCGAGWVLLRCYGAKKPQLIQCLSQLLDSPEVILESQAAVTQALDRFAKAKVDFIDCLIERCGHVAGCGETVTFDVNASAAAGMILL